MVFFSVLLYLRLNSATEVTYVQLANLRTEDGNCGKQKNIDMDPNEK